LQASIEGYKGLMSEIDFSHNSELTYRAIGRFIFEFSQLEAALKYYIAEKCEIKNEHYAALMVHDFAMLCSIAKKVLVAPDDIGGKDMNAIISACRKLNDVRVRVAHGLWVPFMEGGTVHHTSRQSLTPQMSSHQTKELEKSASDTHQLRFDFERYANGRLNLYIR
jgi:hypothetical protein